MTRDEKIERTAGFIAGLLLAVLASGSIAYAFGLPFLRVSAAIFGASIVYDFMVWRWGR